MGSLLSMRVLHILDHSWPVLDGYAQRSRSIVSAQRQIGMEPAVVTSPLHEVDDPKATDTSLDGVDYFRSQQADAFSRAAIGARWPVLRELAIVRVLERRVEGLLES